MGGYIFLRCTSGICDSIFMLEMLTPYAQKYDRTIIWDLMLYTASDLDSIFDFSNYPVKVLCGSKHVNDILFSRIEPTCFGNNVYAGPIYCGSTKFSINGELAQFDRSKDFPSSVLLIYYGGCGGWITMDNIRFNKKLINEYYSKLELLPEKFVAIHLRATDYPGYNEEEDIAKVDKFVEKHPDIPTYLASDNIKLIEKLCEKHKQLVKPFSYRKIDYKYRSLHHTFGNIEPDCVTNALIDILMCASADDFLQSRGGFSRFINHLYCNKKLLKNLLQPSQMGGYIILRVQSGFNDGLLLIFNMTQYALKYNRTIILTFERYTATKLDSIFDFSKYPVPIICGEEIVPSLKYDLIEPTCYGMDPYTLPTSRAPDYSKLINGMRTRFDLTKEYPDTTLLIWDSVGARELSMVQVFKDIQFTSEFLVKFKKQRNMFPTVFNAIHVRGTDDPLKNKEKTMELIDEFIESNPNIPTYLASDDMPLMDELTSKYNAIVKPLSYKKIDYNYYSLHHAFGKSDPECLSNAIIDLLMCASSKNFLRSTGGFSGLMQKLHEDKELLNRLILS